MPGKAFYSLLSVGGSIGGKPGRGFGLPFVSVQFVREYTGTPCPSERDV